MKKNRMLLLLILVISFVASGCAKEENKFEKVKIVLDWTPNTNHTGLYVAQEKGYFNKAGLEVEIMQPPEGSTTALIGAGKAEFGISFQDTLAYTFANKESMPVTAVAAIIQHNTSGIVSLKEKGIDSPEKLSGHSYATWDDPIELGIVKKVVEDAGGDYEKVKLIPNTVEDVVTALKTDIEAVWIYYAWDGIATKLAGQETNFLKFADYGEELDYYSPVIIAGDKYLEENPEQAKKVVQAIKKGYEFAIQNPEEAADILVKKVPELDKDFVLESQKWLANEYQADADQWGYIDPKRWDRFYQWVFENKLIGQEIPPGMGFTNDFLGE